MDVLIGRLKPRICRNEEIGGVLGMEGKDKGDRKKNDFWILTRPPVTERYKGKIESKRRFRIFIECPIIVMSSA